MAVFEAIAGVGLLFTPVLVVSVLLETPLDTPGGLISSRIAGAALIALAIACWQGRDAERNGAALGILAAMFFYNIAVAALLAYGGVRLGLQSMFIWPTIVLHSALSLWCGILLWMQKGTSKAETTM